MKNHTENAAGNKIGSETRLKYQTPRLQNYGSLVELTRAGDFFGNDGNTECTGNSNAAQDPCIS